MKEIIKNDELTSTNVDVANESSKQTRHDTHKCTRHNANLNGDVVSCCKQKHKKNSESAANIKSTPNGDIIMSGEHRKMCRIEVTCTSDNDLNYTNVIMNMIEIHAI